MTEADVDVAARTDAASAAARAGGAVAAGYFRTDVDVESKSRSTDLVSTADREAQRIALAVLQDYYPGETVVAEEAGPTGTVPGDGAAWIVDPVDGTSNFLRGRRAWGTAVAGIVDGRPVAAAVALPELGDVYVAGDSATLNGDAIRPSDRSDPAGATVAPLLYWPRDRRDDWGALCTALVDRFDDLRRVGSAQATLAMVAAGQLDGVVTDVRGFPWDTVAGVHLIRAAGGRVTDVHGDPWRHDAEGLVASNGEIHDALLASLPRD
ncbi:MAG: inositol monophosphatase [Halobacteriaceae archaeon]